MSSHWSRASLIGFVIVAACSHEENKHSASDVDLTSFLTSCVPYCKKELSCHPQLSQFVDDCKTYCNGRGAELFPDAGTVNSPCNVQRVTSKLEQCSGRDQCNDFDSCAASVTGLCTDLVIESDGGIADGGSASGGGPTRDSGAGGATNEDGATSGGGGKGGSTSGGGATASGGANDGGPTSSDGGASGGGTGGMWTAESNLDAQGVLIAPPRGSGLQITTPAFSVSPGQEVFNCYHTDTGVPQPLAVGEWESQLTVAGVSVTVLRGANDSSPSGTLSNGGCTTTFGGPNWLYTSHGAHTHLRMPDGVVMSLGSRERLLFDMHYLNTGTDPLQVQVRANLYQANSRANQSAGALIAFNTGIAIPPNGMQTVGGDCTPPAGASFFYMTTHTFKRGIDASITEVSADGSLGPVLVRTTDPSSPVEETWMTGDFLSFGAGEKFHYSCSFQNDRAATLTVGESAANNEQCMAIAYYFPAGTGVCN